MATAQQISFPDTRPEALMLPYKASVDPRTGNANIEVSIPLSAGRGGFQPSLGLVYTSSGRNTPFGVGWSMSGLPNISLNLKDGFPKYDGTEQYIFGGQELVPWLIQEAENWRARTDETEFFRIEYFRPKIEGSFNRFEKWTNKTSGAIHWRVKTPSNHILIFGATSEGTSKIFNPEHPEQILIWQLDAQFDNIGNAILYEYKPEDDEGIDKTAIYERHRLGTLHLSQKYLKRIRYGNTLPEMPDVPTLLGQHWAFEVIFDFGEHHTDGIPSYAPTQSWPPRADVYSVYGSGFELRTYRLCRRILMFHHFEELGEAPTLVGNFEIVHLHQALGSLIQSFSYTAYRYDQHQAGYQSKTLPSLRFSYTEAALANSFIEADERTVQNAPLGIGGVNYKWIDLYGEGLPGILYESNFAWYYKPNLGQGQLGKQEPVPFKPSASFGGYSLADFDNDGNLNVVILQGREAGYYEYNRDKEQWSAFQTMPNAPQVSGNAQLMDLTGDGRADLVTVEQDRISWFPSKGKEGFGIPETISKPISNGVSRLPTLGSVPMLDYFFADMTGDGLPDQIRVLNGRVEYWPNLGRGRFGEGILMGEAPVMENDFEFDASRVRLIDLSGNGVSDLVYIGKGEIRYWFNAFGNYFTEGRFIKGLPYIDHLSSAQILDFLGNGTPCLVWCSPLSGHSDAPLQYLPLTNNIKPFLLVGIQNDMGRETRFHYSYSVQHYLRDKRNGTPWISKIPSHSTVADRLEEIDLIGGQNMVSRYEYHDGFYDGEERSFRGFCHVDQYDAESYIGPADEIPLGFTEPVCTRIWYHNGMPGWRERREAHYFKGDAGAPSLQEVVIENLDAIGPEEYFDAYRALAGQVLRTEVFGLHPDGVRRPNPYQVTQNNFLIRRIQTSTKTEDASFAVFPLENINCQYEQIPNDPLIAHSVVLSIDAYGQNTQTAAIAYPRRSGDLAAQRRLHILVNYSDIRHFDQVDRYQLAVPYEQKTFELSGITPESSSQYFSIQHLTREIASALPFDIPFHQEFTTGYQSRLISWDRIYYWNDDQSAVLPWRAAGNVLLVHHTEKACFNEAFLLEALGDRHDAARLEHEGMYHFQAHYWWQPSPITYYFGPERFFAARAVENSDGGVLTYAYDNYVLALVRTANFIRGESEPRLAITAEIDYHLLAPWRITDPNNNVSEVRYDAFGIMVAATNYGEKLSEAGTVERMGHEPIATYRQLAPTSFEGILNAPADYIQQVGSYLYYELDTWQRNREPLCSIAIARENWVHDGNGNVQTNSPVQIALEYRDGFGRPLQSKQLVESGLAIARNPAGEILLDGSQKPIEQYSEIRWKVSGHVQYNNKQQPVRQFEPYFSSLARYEADSVLRTLGNATLLRYDAVGRQIETRFPDGSFNRVEIEAWLTRQYDANDTVSGSAYETQLIAAYPDAAASQRVALRKAILHQDTPVVTHTDPLGRVFLLEETNENGDKRTEKIVFHVSGEPLRIEDAREITVFQYHRDMNGRIWHEESADAGPKWQFLNALDQATHIWDARGVHKYVVYDAMGRMVSAQVDGALGMNHLTDRFRYGDEPGVENAALHNSKGQAVEIYDTAGVTRISAYDIAGNVLRSERQLVDSYREIPNWQMPSAVALMPESYVSRITYDALGRPIVQHLPDLTTRNFEFHQSGLLRRALVSTGDGLVSNQAIIQDITYNARGQRVSATLGNEVRQTYTYDERSFRLLRMTARRPAQGSTPARLYQDLRYTYDPVGNITQISDLAQDAGASTPIMQGLSVTADQRYTYDAFYQLIEAEGRIHQALERNDASNTLEAPGLIKGTRHISLNNGSAIRRYRRTYAYDLAGNRLQMQHTTLGLGTETNRSWNAQYWVAPTSNRSLPLRDLNDIPISAPESRFDANGNCLYLPHLRRFEWDFRNQLASAVIIERSGDAPDDAEYYVYDGNSQRVRKVRERVIDATTGRLEIEEKIYLDGCEIKRIRRGDAPVLERITSHLTDGGQRIALLHQWVRDNTGRETDDVNAKTFHYQLSDHLGSSSMELNERGELICYEAYFPFGGAAFMAGDQERDIRMRDYRYSGKEQDDSTGLYYYGYRYYAPWLGRWLSPDPIGPEDGLNLYGFVGNNPVNRVDEEGLQSSYSRRPLEIREASDGRVYVSVTRNVPDDSSDDLKLSLFMADPSPRLTLPSSMFSYLERAEEGVHIITTEHFRIEVEIDDQGERLFYLLVPSSAEGEGNATSPGEAGLSSAGEPSGDNASGAGANEAREESGNSGGGAQGGRSSGQGSHGRGSSDGPAGSDSTGRGSGRGAGTTGSGGGSASRTVSSSSQTRPLGSSAANQPMPPGEHHPSGGSSTGGIPHEGVHSEPGMMHQEGASGGSPNGTTSQSVEASWWQTALMVTAVIAIALVAIAVTIATAGAAATLLTSMLAVEGLALATEVTVAIGALSTGLGMMAGDAVTQGLMIGLGMQEEFSVGQMFFNGGVGLLTGGATTWFTAARAIAQAETTAATVATVTGRQMVANGARRFAAGALEGGATETARQALFEDEFNAWGIGVTAFLNGGANTGVGLAGDIAETRRALSVASDRGSVWLGMSHNNETQVIANELLVENNLMRLPRGALSLEDIGRLSSAEGAEFSVMRVVDETSFNQYLGDFGISSDTFSTGERLLMRMGSDRGTVPPGVNLILHTHPGRGPRVGNNGSGLRPSDDDISTLQELMSRGYQSMSAIVNETGHFRFFSPTSKSFT